MRGLRGGASIAYHAIEHTGVGPCFTGTLNGANAWHRLRRAQHVPSFRVAAELHLGKRAERNNCDPFLPCIRNRPTD